MGSHPRRFKEKIFSSAPHPTPQKNHQNNNKKMYQDINQKGFSWLLTQLTNQTTEECACCLLTLVTRHHYAVLN